MSIRMIEYTLGPHHFDLFCHMVAHLQNDTAETVVTLKVSITQSKKRGMVTKFSAVCHYSKILHFDTNSMLQNILILHRLILHHHGHASNDNSDQFDTDYKVKILSSNTSILCIICRLALLDKLEKAIAA